MEIKTIKVTPKMLAYIRRAQVEASRRGLSVDWESGKLTTIKPSNRNQYWLEGDQDTPDLYKEEESEQ